MCVYELLAKIIEKSCEKRGADSVEIELKSLDPDIRKRIEKTIDKYLLW